MSERYFPAETVSSAFLDAHAPLGAWALVGRYLRFRLIDNFDAASNPLLKG